MYTWTKYLFRGDIWNRKNHVFQAEWFDLIEADGITEIEPHKKRAMCSKVQAQ